MTKSDLIEILANKLPYFQRQDVDDSVHRILERISAALSCGQRIEVRDFGAFSLRDRPPRMARNPRTGEAVAVVGTRAVYFRPGKELRERVDNADRLAALASGPGDCDRSSECAPPAAAATSEAESHVG